jgi:hypothetical protein
MKGADKIDAAQDTLTKHKSDIYSCEIFKSLVLSDSGQSGNIILKKNHYKKISLNTLKKTPECLYYNSKERNKKEQ